MIQRTNVKFMHTNTYVYSSIRAFYSSVSFNLNDSDPGAPPVFTFAQGLGQPTTIKTTITKTM